MVVGAQSGFSVRLEWGPVGAAVVAAGCDAVVVVDVLGGAVPVLVDGVYRP